MSTTVTANTNTTTKVQGTLISLQQERPSLWDVPSQRETIVVKTVMPTVSNETGHRTHFGKVKEPLMPFCLASSPSPSLVS